MIDKKEYILCAAIHLKNDIPRTKGSPVNVEYGLVICGRRHSDCYHILKVLSPKTEFPDRDCQGFITSHNRYVDRSEAFLIAKENGQMWHTLFDGDDEGQLASEDLYFLDYE